MSSLLKKYDSFHPQVVEVFFTEDQFCIRLLDGREIRNPLEAYPKLRRASPEVRNNYKILGLGEAIHWPDLDEDLSVEGIVLGLPVIDW